MIVKEILGREQTTEISKREKFLKPGTCTQPPCLPAARVCVRLQGGVEGWVATQQGKG